MSKTTKKITRTLKDIPIEHVMAFNAVSARVMVGVSAGFLIDGGLERDVEVIITTKDTATLVQACDTLGLKLDVACSTKTGISHMKDLRVIPLKDARYSPHASSGNQTEDEEL